MRWYYGFKLHIIVNDMGELMAFKMSKATTDDRVVLPKMAENLTGKIIGDKGYISQKLFDQLYEKGLQLITKIRKNMKNKLVLMIDKILLRKRGIIESVFDQLKNISQIEHSRHRSADNFMVNIVAGLAAYCLQEKKPSLGIKYNLLRKRRYLGRYFAHPMMQNRRAKRDDYKPSAVRVTQRYVP